MFNKSSGYYDLFEYSPHNPPRETQLINQKNLRNYFGAPFSITKEGNSEVWHYEKTKWVGVIPWLVVPIPLLLPTGQVSIDFTFINGQFQNLKQKNLQVKQSACRILPIVSDHGGGFCSTFYTTKRFQP